MYNFYLDNILWIQDTQGHPQQPCQISVKRGLKQNSKGYSSPDTAAMAYLILNNFWKGTTSNGSMPSKSFSSNNSNFIYKIINIANS